MIPWSLWMLFLTVVMISAVDIRYRSVEPVVIVPLVTLMMIGWSFGLWDLHPIGGTLVLIASLLIRLPLGDVFGLAICGFLTGPVPTMTALLVCSLGLLILLRTVGHRVRLVRHPFFPYVGVLVLIFSITFTR